MKYAEWFAELRLRFRFTGNTVADDALQDLFPPDMDVLASVLDTRLDKDDYVVEWRITLLCPEHLITAVITPTKRSDGPLVRLRAEVNRYSLRHVAKISGTIKFDFDRPTVRRKQQQYTVTFTQASGLADFHFPPSDDKITRETMDEYGNFGEALSKLLL